MLRVILNSMLLIAAFFNNSIQYNMKKIIALQKNVTFVFCPHPVTIDKSKEWGEGNYQDFQNGVFLKINYENGFISHGVQPSSDLKNPVGWIKTEGNKFSKKDAWYIKELKPNTTETIETIDYEVKEPAVLLCQDLKGQANFKDMWVLPLRNFERFYRFS